MRLILVVVLALGLGALSWHIARIENYKASSLAYLKDDQPKAALSVASEWLTYDPSSAKAWHIAGDATLALYLLRGQPLLLQEAEAYLKESAKLFKSDPTVYESLAKVASVKARIGHKPLAWGDYIHWMQKACSSDPHNYYYYSVFFEELVTLANDMEFLQSDFPKEDWLHALGDALANYLRLKSWYREEYMQLLSLHFTQDQQKIILSRLP